VNYSQAYYFTIKYFFLFFVLFIFAFIFLITHYGGEETKANYRVCKGGIWKKYCEPI